HELRLSAARCSAGLAAISTLTAAAGATAAMGGGTARVVVGDGSMTATWSGICAPNGQNRIGLYTPGAADGSYLAWQNTGGAASGSMAFPLPANLAPGTYELRLFAEQFSGRLATSNAFAVAAAATATSTPTA